MANDAGHGPHITRLEPVASLCCEESVTVLADGGQRQALPAAPHTSPRIAIGLLQSPLPASPRLDFGGRVWGAGAAQGLWAGLRRIEYWAEMGGGLWAGSMLRKLSPDFCGQRSRSGSFTSV